MVNIPILLSFFESLVIILHAAYACYQVVKFPMSWETFCDIILDYPYGFVILLL